MRDTENIDEEVSNARDCDQDIDRQRHVGPSRQELGQQQARARQRCYRGHRGRGRRRARGCADAALAEATEQTAAVPRGAAGGGRRGKIRAARDGYS